MNLVGAAASVAERVPLGDGIMRAGIALLVDRTRSRLLNDLPTADQTFAAPMAEHPIALYTDAANAQHYELPPAFFVQVLGPRREYSCCLFQRTRNLARAEDQALAETAANARLEDDGQRILELGCDWESLTLWMGERFPRARIVAVSNSRPRRAHVEMTAAQYLLRPR
jgi:cyclopropane-fatty-acyl-phospholipid synthase